MKTKAAILVKQHQPLVVDQVEIPALKRGQVLVRIHSSGMCGSQIGEIDGVKGPDPHLPHLLGHEAGGVVEETGSGVTRVKKADRVILHWRPGPGIQADTPQYRWGLKTVNAGWVTTFQERAVVSENRLTKMPAGVGMEEAALYGCALLTGFGVVKNDAALKKGESLVVLGAGGMGLSEIIAAHAGRARPIVAVDLYPHKLSLAKSYGATHAVRFSSVSKAKTALEKILKSKGADVVFENTGNPRLIELGYEIAGPRGRVILVGVPPKGQKARLYTLPLHFGKVLTGSHGGAADPARDIPAIARLERSGLFDSSKMITHFFPLEKVNEAIRAVRRGRAVRCLLTMGGSKKS